MHKFQYAQIETYSKPYIQSDLTYFMQWNVPNQLIKV